MRGMLLHAGLLSSLLAGGAPEPAGSSNSGAYVLVSPGILNINLSTTVDKYGHQWGTQAGRLWRSKRHLAIGVGAGFEHAWFPYSISFGIPTAEFISHFLRLQAETMPGLMFVDGKLFVHATVGLGYFLIVTRSTFMGTTEVVPDAHGPVLSPGVGLSYRVWRGLAVGVQAGFDLQWVAAVGPLYFAPALDLDVSLGWFF